MFVILLSLGCLFAILTTTFAMAELLTSSSLPMRERWTWILVLLIFSMFAAIAWYCSRARTRHAPVSLFEESGSSLSRIDVDDLIAQVDAFRRIGP